VNVKRSALIALPLAFACNRAPETQVAMNAGTNAVIADTVVVYKSPTCGCCNKWVDHMKEHGFTVVTHDMNDVTPMKQQLGVPANHTSCHTAKVAGYTIEGHVPADLVRKMLNEKATFRGLAVGGMPMGSPGMEGVIKQEYDVMAFDEKGNVQVYARR
jgi:hypothetical protein